MADVADADLPVFPFKVNWKHGVAERLEWKTDILADLVGNEQRRGLRLHPRRDFEVTLTLWDEERSFLDLWLHRMVGSEFLFPIWHDSVRASQSAAQGQKTIWVDTEGLEFRIGSYGLLRGLTAMSFERFQIAEVHADRIVAVDDLEREWPRGTRVEPLVRGQMTEQTRMALVSTRASETQAAFQTTRAQEYEEGVDSADQYLGMSVVTQQPNRTEALDVQHVWTFADSDSGTGRRYRKSEAGRASTSQKHAWFLRGRTAKGAFRSLLYRLKGSLGAVWLPTFNMDMTLAQDAGAGAASIYVNEIGFAYTGGPTSGREYIAIQTRTGWLYRRITGTAVAPAGQERLVLDEALPDGLLRKDVRIISWMDTARLENDRIEFNHVNAADGVSTVASIFKTFRNDREQPDVLEYPIPVTAMNSMPCGTARLDWHLKVRFRIVGGGNPAVSPYGWLFYDVPDKPNAPHGRDVSGANTNQSVYEYNDPVLDPILQGQVLVKCESGPLYHTWVFYYPVEEGKHWTLRNQFGWNTFPEGSAGGIVEYMRVGDEDWTEAANVVVPNLWPEDYPFDF